MKQLKAFLIGVLVSALFVLGTFWLIHKYSDEKKEDYKILTNQITKMNKMLVIEQNLSSVQKVKITNELMGVGDLLPSFSKEIITYTKVNAQVTYNLNQMKIQVDSVNKKLILKELPKPELKIFPSVEIQSLEDSFFNRFDEKDFKKITESAKQSTIRNIDQQKLINESKVQLVDNLKQIFILAKALNYSIIDETRSIDSSKL